MLTRTERIRYLNELLNLMERATKPMVEIVFEYYAAHKSEKDKKVFYNLLADAFLSIHSYCLLMLNQSWSQAFTVLRLAIEQVASVSVLIDHQEAIPEFIRLRREGLKQKHLSDEDKAKKLSEKRKKNGNYYYDYGWLLAAGYDQHGRRQLLQAAHLEELNFDIEETLNKFVHGTLTVFDLTGKDGWELMRRYGVRANLACCMLFDHLCCAYRRLTLDVKPTTPINEVFEEFRILSHIANTFDNAGMPPP